MKNVLFLLALCSTLMLNAQVGEDEHAIAHQYIVMMKPGQDVMQLINEEPLLQTSKCLSKRMNIWLLQTVDGQAHTQLLDKLRSNKQVKLAQHNHSIEQRSLVPNDPYFNVQWDMMNDGTMTAAIAGADIQATDAWAINHDNVTANGDTVVIAIIDAKFDLSQEDINYFVNRNEIAGNGIDDDGNGYIDDVRGWSVGSNTDAIDATNSSANHSTHTAGIAAAIGENGKGIAGVCWGAKVMAVDYSSTQEANVVAAYDYVREMRLLHNATLGAKGAFVVATNSSFGVNNGMPANFPIWCAMYDSMGAVGILSSGATSNSNINVDEFGDIPTACPSKWLMTVNSTNREDGKHPSGYGKTTIDLGAPGQGVYSTYPNNIYQALTGTSMATPHVTGAVGMLYAAACNSLLDAYEEQPDSIALLIKQYILDGTEWLPGLNNLTVTGGRLNLYRAMENLSRYNCDSCNFTVSIDKLDIVCRGDSNGALMVNVSGSPSNYTFLWSNGSTNPELLNQAPGFYTVGVMDNTGCQRTWTAELHEVDSIRVNTITVLNGNPYNIVVSASAGNAKLEYSLDGATYQSNALFAVSEPGTYTVYIKTETGCVLQREVIIVATGIADAGNAKFSYSLYPNPASDVLNLNLELQQQGLYNISLSNVLGQQLAAQQVQLSAGIATHQLATDMLSNGAYYVTISQGSHSISRKFVVAR